VSRCGSALSPLHHISIIAIDFCVAGATRIAQYLLIELARSELLLLLLLRWRTGGYLTRAGTCRQ